MNTESSAGPVLATAPSPHLSNTSLTTRRMMIDVLLALLPALAVSIYVFHWYAIVQVGICCLSCLTAEALFSKMRGRGLASLGDCSALVTGVILGMSLPWSAAWYIGVIGSFIAIGFGKALFGGLGGNIFNPAMVGRAFVMLSFAKDLGASAYVSSEAPMRLVTQATPLTAAKAGEAGMDLTALFVGMTNGSVGETSALALLIGGIYLCVRRTAAWEIPASIIASVFVLGALTNWAGLSPVTSLQHLCSGSLMLGAFFIATDPVSSPLTMRGKIIFGAGVGFFIVLLRVFSSYPEGVMFAVLLMNAAAPLIDRYSVPRPLGMATEKAA